MAGLTGEKKMSDIGHNSVNTDTAKRLLSIIERIERLEEERKALGDDVKDIYREAKSAGFDAPTIRMLIKHRAEDAAKREEREALLETYLAALGQLVDTPLGKAAQERF
jgi:uncharacterized protein (UPF0335 family)